MTIQAFFTQNTQSMTAAGGNNTAAGGSPVQGLAFWELILGNALQKNSLQTGETQELVTPVREEKTVLQSDNPLLEADPELNIAELLAASPELKEKIVNLIKPITDNVQDEITQTLALNQQVFDELLKPILKATLVLTESGEVKKFTDLSKITVQDLLNVRTDEDLNTLALENLELGEGDSEEKQVGIPAKILLSLLEKVQSLTDTGQVSLVNLTPEEITKITQVTPAEISETVETVEYEAGPPPAAAVIEILKALLPMAQLGLHPPQPAAPQSNESEKIQINPGTPQKKSLPEQLNNLPVGAVDGEEVVNFGQIMKGLRELGDDGVAPNTKLVKDGAKPTVNPNTAPKVLHTLPNLASLVGIEGGALHTPSEWVQGVLERLGLASSTSPITGLNNLTNLISQSQSAAQAHPGTQMIAATIQRVGANGENRSILLQLDPPELGRVDVQMNFGKDKMVKAILTIEKPETMAMLQRDAHVLERAMTDIGLDTDGGVELQLAGDEHAFDQDGSHDGSRNQSGSSSNAEDELEIIESIMTWQVDPETGHVSYNIWA